MNYATNIAIVKGKKVEQIIWGNIYQIEEFEETYGCKAVPIDDLSVSIGDTYDGKVFRHDRKVVLTKEERYEREVAEADQYALEVLYNAITEGVK